MSLTGNCSDHIILSCNILGCHRSSSRAHIRGLRWIAIQLNVLRCEVATEVDYFLTNTIDERVNETWLAHIYLQSNWVEVF